MNLNRSLPSVDPSHFAMVPRSDVPRSTFKTEHTLKSTFDCDYLVPIHVDEVLPGDVHQGNVTVFARVNNLLFPLMDNLTLETFFFFVPARLLWSNWKKFMGEQAKPSDSISYTIPQMSCPTNGYLVGSLQDYMGLPTVGQISAGAGTGYTVSVLPFRAFNLIYNEWFRDENLQDSVPFNTTDATETYANFTLLKRNKRHDYFTSCLPWPLKGGVDITLPLGGLATVNPASTHAVPTFWSTGNNVDAGGMKRSSASALTAINIEKASTPVADTNFLGWNQPNLVADLSTATGATINAMRLSVATQQFLEKNARGGTRYTELLHNHFGVTPEDSRLQRPEYIGGGRSSIHTSAIPQTSATGLTGGTTPAGSLTAQALVADRHHFTYHATEHGYIIGLANVTGDITYQQGLPKMWSRLTRYDFYWPTFANLGEQAVLNREIYSDGTAADDGVFGYQERWAEYRYRPSRITGLFKSTSTGNIDEWTLAQQFTSLPALNTGFITQATPASRVLAAGVTANGMQILFDSVFTITCTRPVPTYSVPGLTRF